MRIHENSFRRAWREPDEIDFVALREARRTSPPPAPAPQPQADTPFWDAAPAAPTALQQMAPPPVQAPPPPPSHAPYVGERPVEAAWLQQRETALGTLRAEYEAAMALARSRPGQAPGWVVANPDRTAHGGANRVLQGELVYIVDRTVRTLRGDTFTQGHHERFDARVFEADWQARLEAGTAAPAAQAALQALAVLYDSTPERVFADRPGLWPIAIREHAINAGPAPTGRAMGDPGQLGMLDLYLADPQIAELIATFGGTATPATGGLAPEQVRIYGEQRYAQLTKLGQAMQAVRDDYNGALAHAQAHGGPGWVSTTYEITYADEGTVWRSGEYATRSDFSVDAFTDWYIAQGGVAHRAFASFYGRSRTEYGSDESGAQFVSRISFDNPNWQMAGVGAGMSHGELVRFDPNHPPELNDSNAIGFDLEAGWATPHGNIHEDRDWFGTLVQVAMVAAVSYVTAGTLGAAASAAVGGGVAGAAASAAVVGAAASVASGAMSGNLSLKGVLTGALSGALSVGLMGGLNQAVGGLGTAGTIAARTTIQGGIQALLGGSFKDGALAGFASGLADLAGDSLQANIDAAVRAGTMSTAQAAGAHTFARVLGSAIRAAGNPDDPAYGFASAFLEQTLRDIDPAGFRQPVVEVRPLPGVQGTVFDDDGNLMPGVVDPALPPLQQAEQLRERLIGQGLAADEATWLAAEAVFTPPDVAMPTPTVAAHGWSAEELQARADDVERAVQHELAAWQAREDSLLAPEDLLVETGGGGGARAPVQPVLNRGFDAALNAASDVAGLLEPLQGLRAELGKLQALQAESRIEAMRVALRNAGMANVPDGYELAWDANGNAGRDYGATAGKLNAAYEGFLRDQRLRANWGEGYEALRIGRSQMTVQQFEARLLEVQQRAANDAYERGKLAIATGELPLKNNDYILTLGTYVDEQVRRSLRSFGLVEGLPDSGASVVFAVNRRITGNGMSGVPDLRVGRNLLSDTTLTPKNGNTEQLRRWNEIRPNDTLIVRPDALGGSYVVPRSTIRPIVPRGRGG